MTDMNLLQEVRKISTEIRGDKDSGNAYLMGYLWASLTNEQQIETAESFRNELAEVRER
jgi:hypothetical protein